MARKNADKVKADVKKIVRRLRTTDITMRQLGAEYHCRYETIKRLVLSKMSPDEYRQLARKRLARGGVNTRFKPGVVSFRPPKGVRYSPQTEFKKGHLPHNARPLGTISIRTNKRDKRMIAVPGPTPARHKWISYAQYIWEQEHGPLPEGMLVVHLDGDSMNDVPENLKAVDRAGNIELMKKNNPGHRKKAVKSYKKTVRKRRVRKAREQARQQRQIKIAERRELKRQQQAALEAEHKELAEQQKLELYGPQVVVWECTNCSAEYEQKEPPERCAKCGRFSFEKNVYRRKTG